MRQHIESFLGAPGGRFRGFGFTPPFPPPGGHRGFGRGHGRGRGRGRPNVRQALLALLAERPMHGYEMIQELESRTGGLWRPSPGSVYPTLQLLEDEGLIIGAQSSGKRLFSLAESGRTEAEAQEAPPWAEITEDAG